MNQLIIVSFILVMILGITVNALIGNKQKNKQKAVYKEVAQVDTVNNDNAPIVYAADGNKLNNLK